LELLGDKQSKQKKYLLEIFILLLLHHTQQHDLKRDVFAFSCCAKQPEREKNPKTKTAEIPQKHISILLT
jgi:hypothetical protein